MASSISAIVPVYNGEAALPELIRRLDPVLQAATSGAYEIILVNDGSQDRSWEKICELAATNSRIVGLNLMRNSGQHNALLAGIRTARMKLVATVDDDLQNPPEEIPKLLEVLNAGNDIVYGYPEREQHQLWRNLASQITKIALQSAMGVECARRVSPFRVFRTEIRQAFAEYRSPHTSIDALLTWGSTRFAAIPVRHDPREIGNSNYTFRKLFDHALNMITGFTVLPLQLASFVGFFFTLFGFGVLTYVLARYFTAGGVVPGFAFLASAIAIFAGAQLFALGVIGEYLARVHFRLMDRPPYTVGAQTPSAAAPAGAARNFEPIK